MLDNPQPLDIILNANQDKLHVDIDNNKSVKDYDYYEDIKSIVIDVRNELTLDKSIQKLNSYIQWLLLKQKNVEEE